MTDRTNRAVAAAVVAARELGLNVEHPTVLHDVFSVVVHLRPEPVVARIPVVLTASLLPERQAARQQRELDVTAWLDRQGVPVVAPSPLVPRSPVRRDGFPITFWELADVADDHQPYQAVDLSFAARLHAALARYPGELPFLAPFNDGIPAMLEGLGGVDILTTRDIERAREEYEGLRRILADPAAFASTFPQASVQPIQGDGPSHNVIRTKRGVLFADFEDVCEGPVEWDLAMLGADAVDHYDTAAQELGLRATNREVLRVMDCARRLQFVCCLTLIPQLPLLAEGLGAALEEWRGTPSFS
ncbi:phosphotransferase [Mycolicibacterium sp. BiH015]|uniref:phosphotransferase n=1 Tax=Mycolicibacterium sp. BiH015 TaxID=3018808 RepID=UPI0022E13510|nr:phosphotransferase [Mycolicibacterium sp. BiH015]MDA2894014.1 phosphotransferase [Mycolicibacterium sp. BiH015]